MTAEGIKNVDLARILEVNPGLVSHWLNPNRPDQMPGHENCYLLCGHLGIDLMQFVYEEE